MKHGNTYSFKFEPIKGEQVEEYNTYELLALPLEKIGNENLDEYFSQLDPVSSKKLLLESFNYLSQFHNCKICINLNQSMLSDPHIYMYLIEEFIYLTESNRLTFAVEVNEKCAEFITQDENKGVVTMLKNHGIEIWLDDFGCGNANFSVLSHNIFEVVKIDKGIFWVLHNESKLLLVELIYYFHKVLRLGVVLEGVETKDQLKFVYQCGGMAQGYYFR